MVSPENSFAPLPQPDTAEGGPRLTGVEIELGGLDEAEVKALSDLLSKARRSVETHTREEATK